MLYHFAVSHEDPQIQYGYTGNRAQGIIASYASGTMSDITIENVESYYGSAWGMVLYKGNQFAVGNIAVHSVHAGSQMTASQAQSLTLPNLMPLACSVEQRDGANITSLSGNTQFEDVVGSDIIGHKLCDNPTNNYGDLLGVCDESDCAMFDGDTMNGKGSSFHSPAHSSYGSSSGGERVESAPIAVDPPSIPMVYTPGDDEMSLDDINVAEGFVAVHSACNLLEDGIHYILPYGSEDGHLLPVVCNDGNTILDPSLSFERYQSYFSSLYMYDEGIAGPELDDFASWREWFLPLESSEKYIYGVSDVCKNMLCLLLQSSFSLIVDDFSRSIGL